VRRDTSGQGQGSPSNVPHTRHRESEQVRHPCSSMCGTITYHARSRMPPGQRQEQEEQPPSVTAPDRGLSSLPPPTHPPTHPTHRVPWGVHGLRQQGCPWSAEGQAHVGAHVLTQAQQCAQVLEVEGHIRGAGAAMVVPQQAAARIQRQPRHQQLLAPAWGRGVYEVESEWGGWGGG
jgi:hypothetical protein